jgi:hypothetical protein
VWFEARLDHILQWQSVFDGNVNISCASSVPTASINVTYCPGYLVAAGSITGVVVGAAGPVIVAAYVYTNTWYSKGFATANPTFSIDINTSPFDKTATFVGLVLLNSSASVPFCDGTSLSNCAGLPAGISSVLIPRGPMQLSFAGKYWTLKSYSTAVGPGPNFFSASTSDIFVDSAGALTLSVRYNASESRWYSTEVQSLDSFGYGTYIYYLNASSSLDPCITLGLFTWDDAGNPGNAYREIDYEFSRWCNAADPTNAQFVLQPYQNAGNLQRFLAQGPITAIMEWRNQSLRMAVFSGYHCMSAPLLQTTTLLLPRMIANFSRFGPAIPSPGTEKVHLNLWLLNGNPPYNPSVNLTQVSIADFKFVPNSVFSSTVCSLAAITMSPTVKPTTSKPSTSTPTSSPSEFPSALPSTTPTTDRHCYRIN